MASGVLPEPPNVDPPTATTAAPSGVARRRTTDRSRSLPRLLSIRPPHDASAGLSTLRAL